MPSFDPVAALVGDWSAVWLFVVALTAENRFARLV